MSSYSIWWATVHYARLAEINPLKQGSLLVAEGKYRLRLPKILVYEAGIKRAA